MDVRNMPFGEVAAPEADCIRLHLLGDGRVRLEGSALAGDESTTFFGQTLYASEEEAEAAGLAWADEMGVQTLYVSRLTE